MSYNYKSSFTSKLVVSKFGRFMGITVAVIVALILSLTLSVISAFIGASILSFLLGLFNIHKFMDYPMFNVLFVVFMVLSFTNSSTSSSKK